MDATRARLFTFERSSRAEGLHEELTEERDLIEPARRQRPSELFSETRPSTGRIGTLQYGLDDGREAHLERLDADFSRRVAGEVADMLRTTGARRLIVCASPHMLGNLRGAAGWDRESLEIDEIPRDLVKLTRSQLRERLTEYGALPAPPPRPTR